jgi:hypothetical protein
MNLENTSPIKGIFVWMIIFSHNNSYYKKKYRYKYIHVKIRRLFKIFNIIVNNINIFVISMISFLIIIIKI